MARFLRLSDEDVERLFRGVPPEGDEDLRDLAFLLADAAVSLSVPPRSEIEIGHLAQLAEAIRSGSAPERRSTTPTRANARIGRSAERSGTMLRRTVRWVATVVAAAAGLVLLTGALALAGVDLPGTAAETAFQKLLGLELPNQDRDAAAAAVDPTKLPPDASDTAGRVLTVIQEWFEGAPWTGCEFGARVSHAARGLEGEPDTTRCGASGTGGQGPHGQGAGASANAANGHEKANEASNGAASGGGAAEARPDVAGENAAGGASGGS